MMSKKTKQKTLKARRSLNFFHFSMVFLGLLLIVFVLTATFFGLFFLNSVDESLDLRQQASVSEDTTPFVSSHPAAEAIYKAGEEAEISFFANTKTKNFSEFEWEFDLLVNDGLLELDDFEIQVASSSGLQLVEEEWTESAFATDVWENYADSKFETQLIFTVIDAEASFNTHDEDTLVFKLVFTPKKEGRILVVTGGNQFKSFASDFYVSDNGIDAPQCQYYYTAWSECENNWQNRESYVFPPRCRWHESEDLEELSRECQMSDGRGGIVANPNYFYLYSFDNCFNYPNEGEDIYILWDKDEYKDIEWIDVSRGSNFENYYHKSTADAYEKEGMLIINAANFTGATSDISGQRLSFQPDKSYYFRLYNGEEEQYISSVRFYMGFCSGDQSEYLNCNDNCGQGTDDPERACADGLACIDGQCRLESNPNNDWCIAEGQIGIGMPNRACNEYCADSSDCASHLSCYWNQCRLPGNLSDSRCLVSNASTTTTSNTTGTGGTTIASGNTYNNYAASQLPSEAYDLNTYGCNQGCNTNRDCDANYRCYKGQCRLASNPESVSCDVDQVVVDLQLDRSSSDSTGLDLVSDEDYQEYWADEVEKETVATVASTAAKNNWIDQVKGLFTDQAQRSQIWQNATNNFNWQWLALAGFLLIAAITLIVIGLSQKPKELKQRLDIEGLKNESKNQAEKTEKQLEIPENKPTKL